MIDLLCLRLFRRHVRDRADDPSVTREHSGGLARLEGQTRVFFQFGEAEVEHLQPAIGGNHHVGGLQIAMRDAALMGRADRVGQWNGEREQAIEREAGLGDQIRKCLAIDELEREERDAASFFDRMNRDDVRVIERRGRPCLAIEPFAAVRIACQLASQDLERDSALQPGIVGEVDLSHPAFANELNDPVVPEGGPNHAARDSRS